MLTYHTAGESHGKGLLALIDGFPAGLEIQTETINYELKRRQGGYGRGGRQKLETELLPLENFYPAEEYHQKYLEKNPGGYCHIPSRYFSAGRQG